MYSEVKGSHANSLWDTAISFLSEEVWDLYCDAEMTCWLGCCRPEGV